MSQNPCAVLDASALLAYLQGEPGSDRLAEILVQGAVISAINWAETLSKLAERGQDPDTIVTQLIDLGVQIAPPPEYVPISDDLNPSIFNISKHPNL
ncbi:PIN domain-containing protein [Coleofasciculus sp. E2-BRE-01]|uniref:PIN domain-containing protein n=1 Tax=unclassified Coleofasciculus TaxID=2692782 RepID=UPI003304CE98